MTINKLIYDGGRIGKLQEQITNMPSSSNRFKSDFLSRAGQLGLIPVDVISCIADTALGLCSAVGSIVTLAQSTTLYNFASNNLYSLSFILSSLFYRCIKVINPNAEINLSWTTSTDKVIKLLSDLGRTCCKSNNFFKRHVVSRLTYALLAISCVITRVADMFLGVCAALCSILTLGHDTEYNTTAYNNLKVTALLSDIYLGVARTFNPFVDK